MDHRFTFHYGRIQSCEWIPASQPPLNLHSIMVGFNLVGQQTLAVWIGIYIPLWSDSISRRKKMFEELKVFTFHYGRIQSMSSFLFVIALSAFTFHYGRIQSNTGGTLKTGTHEFTFHYGRIQSRCTMVSRVHLNLFTFHYGRIQSVRIIWTAAGMSVFTFHYGRIQSGKRTLEELPEWIYIPLWSDSITSE